MQVVVSILQQHRPLPLDGPPGAGPPPPGGLRLSLPEGVVTRFVLGVLGIEPWQLTMESSEQFTRAPSDEVGVQEGYRVNFRLVPPSSSSDRPPLSTGDAALRLANAEGSAVGPNFFLGDTMQLVRVPICGNGICEAGERALVDAPPDRTTCTDDCGHSYAPCPEVEGFEGGKLPINLLGLPSTTVCPRATIRELMRYICLDISGNVLND
jgi:hypothetical protein